MYLKLLFVDFVQNPFGLFTAATETDAASLQNIMMSTLASRRFVFGYEGMSVGIDRLALRVDCDLVHSFICVDDSRVREGGAIPDAFFVFAL